MVEDIPSGFSDFVNEADYEFIQNNIGMTSFEIMSDGAGPSDLGSMININSEENTLTMEDFKYINQAAYMQSYTNFPPNEPQELCNTDYSGPHDFEVLVDPNALKNPWEYSPILNKIYIDMKHKFPINFSVKSTSNKDQSLFVRVLPVFEEDRYFQEMVCRCICHEQARDPTNYGINEAVAQHIIRCDNTNARYFGDKNAGKRLSIVIPLSSPQAGTDSVKEFFMFVCKNSCVGGMNRRPIQIIFTLENEFGVVLGRRVLSVRVCSCPKRDREKEEKKKEKQGVTQGKKRKLEKKTPPSSTDVDTKVYPFSFNIVGEENLKRLTQCAYDLMAVEVLKSVEGKKQNEATFRKSMNEASELLNKFNE